MFGQSKFVTKGTVIIVVLLIVGTTWANDTTVDHGDLQKIVTLSSYISGTQIVQPAKPSKEGMEEVVVSSNRNIVDPLELGIEKPPLFDFEVEYFPERNSANVADHSELLRFDDRYGRTGFIEVFRVRFGGK